MTNDYTKFSKHNNFYRNNKYNRSNTLYENTKEPEEIVTEESDNLEVEKLTEKEINQLTDNDIINIENPEKSIEGIVFNCTKLNVRQLDSKESRIVDVIDANSKVLINVNKSTNEYYNVITSSGIEGYCLKQYIQI